MDLFADISYPKGYTVFTTLSRPIGWNSKRLALRPVAGSYHQPQLNFRYHSSGPPRRSFTQRRIPMVYFTPTNLIPQKLALRFIRRVYLPQTKSSDEPTKAWQLPLPRLGLVHKKRIIVFHEHRYQGRRYTNRYPGNHNRRY